VTKLLSALALTGALLLAAPASASVVLDQATIPETGTTPFAGGIGWELGTGGLVQTFTAGVAGRLDHVSVDVENWTFIGQAADVRFQLVDASTFAPLFTHDIPAASLPLFGFSGFNFANVLNIDVSSANIDLAVGNMLGIKLSSLNGADNAQVWRAGFSGMGIIYPGGQAYSFDAPPGFPLPIQIGNEFGFRTYMDTSAAPEPQTWALTILGFAMLGGAIRARRTARA
jgi:hypothetical protein